MLNIVVCQKLKTWRHFETLRTTTNLTPTESAIKHEAFHRRRGETYENSNALTTKISCKIEGSLKISTPNFIFFVTHEIKETGVVDPNFTVQLFGHLSDPGSLMTPQVVPCDGIPRHRTQ
jgi:hypothetical protein